MRTTCTSGWRTTTLFAMAISLSTVATAAGLNRAQTGTGDDASATTTIPQWVRTGDQYSPRSRHTATRLLNGDVLLVGGAFSDRSDVVLDNVELYSETSGSWTLGGDLVRGRAGHTATLLRDGTVLVAGGQRAFAGPSAEIYDPVARTSNFTGNLLTSRAQHTATVLHDGRVLIAGGDTSGLGVTTEVYDPTTRIWTATGNLNLSRVGHTMTRLANGKVLVTGGTNNTDTIYDEENYVPTNTAELYDPASGAWTYVGSLGEARVNHTATLLDDGKVLVVGGLSNRFSTALPSPLLLATAELYDPLTATWSMASGLAETRGYHNATLLRSGEVLVTGGYTDGSAPGTYVAPSSGSPVYNPSLSAWRSVGSLDPARSDHTVTLLASGKVLAAGGRVVGQNGGTAYLDRAFLLDPDFAIDGRITGSWYDPNQPGHGLFLQVLSDGRFLAWWFAFNPEGTQQAWFGGVGTYSGNTATIAAVVQPTGGRWIPNFNPRRVSNIPWGSLSFRFADLDHGTVDFNSSSAYGSGSMNLTRLTRPAAATGAAGTGGIDARYTGAWFDPNQSGHGLFVEVLPDNRLLAWWFSFDPLGTQQAWFGGVGTYSGTRANITEVVQPTGGRWIPNFNPQQVTNNPWGELILEFGDCASGVVTFLSTRGYGLGEMELSRLTMPLDAQCP